jgi:nitroreductase
MSTKINVEQFNTLVRERRSVYPQDYTGAAIDDEIVNQILENARWAPTHKLTEPWRFVVFARDGIRKLANSQAEIYKNVTGADGTFNEGKYQKLLSKPILSSHIIAVIMMRDERKSVPEVEETGSVFCAIQNMYLTATAYGVGGYLSTGGITYFREARELFGLGIEDRLVGFFHLGVPKRMYPEGKRKPLTQISRWVTSE